MTQAQLDRTVAARTGESARTVRRLGFQLQAAPVDPEPDRPPPGRRLPVLRPAAPYPGRAGDGSPALAECPGHRCDIYFDFDLADVYVARREAARRRDDRDRIAAIDHDRRTSRPADPAREIADPPPPSPEHDHDHAHPPPGPPPARRLPPLRPRDRPPGPDPAARLRRRGGPTMRPTSVRRTWPSSTPGPGLALVRGGRAAPGRPGRLRGQGRRRPSPWTPSRPTGPWPAGPTGASPRPASTPSRRSGRSAPFPAPPESWADLAPGLLDALAEATATAAEDDTRYALSCLAAAGRRPATIAATDGRQVLIRGGFAFPWDGDVLVRRSPLFASQGAAPRPARPGRQDRRPRRRSASAPGRSGRRSGPASASPTSTAILPGPGSVATRLRLDPGDARFLLDALGRLPGADEAERARRRWTSTAGSRSGPGPPAAARPTELVLSRSAYTGAPVRFQTNREFLARAIRLGCGELEVADADSPRGLPRRATGSSPGSRCRRSRPSGRPTTPSASSPEPHPHHARARASGRRRGRPP